MTDVMQQQRQDGLRARRNLTSKQRSDASQIICNRVCDSPYYYSSSALGCYLPMNDEVDTREIIERAWRANKRVFVPILRGSAEMLFCEITAETQMKRNRFGIWEPTRGFLAPAAQLDVVITPTVAFDNERNRIGMGGGYYDRCFSFLRLRKHWFQPKLIGVAFQCQQVEKITPNTWDIRLYRIFTEAN